MATVKVAISIEEKMLAELDKMVAEARFPNRSRGFQEALQDKLTAMRRQRLAEECAKLDPAEEQALAEEGLAMEIESWDPY